MLFLKKRKAAEDAGTPVRTARADAEAGKGLLQDILQSGRGPILLRPDNERQLPRQHREVLVANLQETMALVPEGDVVLGTYEHAQYEPEYDMPSPAQTVRVEAFVIDRLAVSNEQFWMFVRSGGYEQMALWDQEIWPAIIDFVDTTGQPGPRFWKYGKYLEGEENLPVVGVSWYEACAFARWQGKRLPSDAEWEKSASWPIAMESGTITQRKFPWGETMDLSRCNIWGSHHGRLLPVFDLENGDAVTGIRQLVGNVWEWTTGEYGMGPFADCQLILPFPMRSLRGGAYDTYCDHQASCAFRSGDVPIARKHNIGFRCALALKDAPAYLDAPEEAPQ